MVVPRLDQRSQYYFTQGLAASSVKTYSSGINRYTKFCGSKQFAPLPASEIKLCAFASGLADEGLKHRTIKTYMAGVRYYHIRSGYADPFQGAAMPRLDYVMKGIKRHQAKEGGGSWTRLPITPSLLRELKGVWSATGSDRDTKMIWAACCLCFFGFLRAGEMTVPSDAEFDPKVHLCISDIALDDCRRPGLLRIMIKQSKTDPFRKGVALFVGRTGTTLCPIAALLDYLVVRGSAPGPLFSFADGRLLTRSRFVEKVRDGLKRAGIDQTKYCGHSFRGHNSGGKGCGRLHNKDPRAVGESSVPTVCETAPRTTEWLFLPVS